jgi:hypothetical protein
VVAAAAGRRRAGRRAAAARRAVHDRAGARDGAAQRGRRARAGAARPRRARRAAGRRARPRRTPASRSRWPSRPPPPGEALAKEDELQTRAGDTEDHRARSGPSSPRRPGVLRALSSVSRRSARRPASTQRAKRRRDSLLAEGEQRLDQRPASRPRAPSGSSRSSRQTKRERPSPRARPRTPRSRDQPAGVQDVAAVRRLPQRDVHRVEEAQRADAGERPRWPRRRPGRPRGWAAPRAEHPLALPAQSTAPAQVCSTGASTSTVRTRVAVMR